jgi:hypothetical protein
MKILNYFFAILFGILILNSCKKTKECEEPLDVRQSFLLLSFKNNNGTYIHSEVNPLFSKDSLKVKDENGIFYSVVPQLNSIPNTSSRYWEFDIGPTYNPNTDASSFDNTLCKNFIIFYNYNTTDTIKTCFKSTKTECGSVFTNLQVFNKGLIVGEATNTITTKCLITKN